MIDIYGFTTDTKSNFRLDGGRFSCQTNIYLHFPLKFKSRTQSSLGIVTRLLKKCQVSTFEKNRGAQALCGSDPSHKFRWGSPATPGSNPRGPQRCHGGDRLYEFDMLYLFVLHMINFV